MNIFETLGPKLRKAILLTESNRAMREMLKGNIHPMALQRKGMLRPAEQMERGYLKGIENKRAKHGIRDLDYAEQHAMGLPYNKPGYAVNRQSLADHTTDADTPKRVRKAARKFLRNNPNDKGWTHTLPGNESVVRGHETDELLSKAKSHATIGAQKRGDKQPMQIGNHRGLDVLGKEMQDTARLKAHGSSLGDKVVVRPERTVAKKDNTLKVIPERSTSLQGERHKTGEYDLVRRKAGMDPKSSFVGPQEMRKLRNAKHDVPGAFISQPPERPVINAPMARKAAKMKRRQLRAVSKGLASKYGYKFMKMRGDNPHRFKGNAASMMVNKTFGNISESAVARAGNLQEANRLRKWARARKLGADVPEKVQELLGTSLTKRQARDRYDFWTQHSKNPYKEKHKLANMDALDRTAVTGRHLPRASDEVVIPAHVTAEKAATKLPKRRKHIFRAGPVDSKKYLYHTGSEHPDVAAGYGVGADASSALGKQPIVAAFRHQDLNIIRRQHSGTWAGRDIVPLRTRKQRKVLGTGGKTSGQHDPTYETVFDSKVNAAPEGYYSVRKVRDKDMRPGYALNTVKGTPAAQMFKHYRQRKESAVARAGNLQEANKAVKLLRQIHNGRKDLAIKGLQDAAKDYYDPLFGRKGAKGISSGTRSWARKIKSTKEARKAATRFDRAAKAVSPMSPRSADVRDASRSATTQAYHLGAAKAVKNSQASERSMAKSGALATRMSPKSMEKYAKRAGVSLTDAEVDPGRASGGSRKKAGSFYRPEDKLVHIKDRELASFVHEGGVRGGGHHARVGDRTTPMSTFDDEVSASKSGIRAARRAGLKVTQADARGLTKSLGTYAQDDPATQAKFIRLAKSGVFRKLASKESMVARAGNLQEALSEQTRAMIPKNKFATPTMERVGHADKGLYPIFDKTSAKSALKLSSKHPHLKREITRRAAVYGVKPEVKKDPWGKKGTKYAKRSTPCNHAMSVAGEGVYKRW